MIQSTVVSGLHTKVEDSLRSQGMKYSPNRRALVSTFNQFDGPLTVEQLYDATQPRVPVSSIYRELRTLLDAQVLTMHHTAERVSRFELAEWLSGHHHHMVCVECMAISDISLESKTERWLGKACEQAASEVGYVMTAHSLEIEGLCTECR